MATPSTARLEAARQQAAWRGAELLDTDFRGYRVPHRYRCPRGHEVDVPPVRVKFFGHWCPACNAKGRSSAEPLAAG